MAGGKNNSPQVEGIPTVFQTPTAQISKYRSPFTCVLLLILECLGIVSHSNQIPIIIIRGVCFRSTA